ncbi:MAG: hypothetical protein AAF555_10330 [Verrucomicrobiota bacterium]
MPSPDQERPAKAPFLLGGTLSLLALLLLLAFSHLLAHRPPENDTPLLDVPLIVLDEPPPPPPPAEAEPPSEPPPPPAEVAPSRDLTLPTLPPPDLAQIEPGLQTFPLLSSAPQAPRTLSPTPSPRRSAVVPRQPSPSAPRTPPAPPRPRGPVSASELDAGLRPLSVPRYIFPRALERRGIRRGTVTFVIEVNPSGRTRVLRVLGSTHPELIATGRKVAGGIRFSRPTVNGQAVTATYRLPLVLEAP